MSYLDALHQIVTADPDDHAEGYAAYCEVKDALRLGRLELDATQVENLLKARERFTYNGSDFFRRNRHQSIRRWIGHLLIANRSTSDLVLRTIQDDLEDQPDYVKRMMARHPNASGVLTAKIVTSLTGRATPDTDIGSHWACPHCNAPVTDRPTRQRTCETCGNVYQVRSRQVLFHPRTLVTQTEALVCDVFQTLQTHQKRHGHVSEADFGRHQDMWKGTQPLSPLVVLLSLIDELIEERAGELSFALQEALTTLAAQDLLRSTAKDPRKLQLRSHSDAGRRFVRIVPLDGSCARCRMEPHRQINVLDGIDLGVLPHERCSCLGDIGIGYCHCRIAAA